MKLLTKPLREALNACAPATKARVATPMGHCVRMEAANGLLTLRATNTDVWIERTVACDGDLAPCAVALKLLQQAIELDGAENIELSCNGISLSLSGNANGKLSVLDPAEFPAWPESECVPYGVNCSDLADGIDATVWATAQEDQKRPNLENVAVILSAKLLEVVASDGRIISHYSQPAIACDGGFNVPKQFTDSLVAALRMENAQLAISDKAAVVTHQHGRTRVKLSEEIFPSAWRAMVAQKADLPWLELPVDELKATCSAALAYWSPTKSPLVTIDWLPEGAVILATHGDTGHSREKRIEHPDAVAGDAYAGLNARYLLGALQHMNSPRVKFFPGETSSFWEFGNLSVLISQLGVTPPSRVAGDAKKA